VAFVGRSNVGKSSLIATLTDRTKLVRVSRRPGRTQALNFFRVRTDAGALVFVDMPGYGYAEAPAAERAKWGPLITGYLADRTVLCLIVWLLDPRRSLNDDDAAVMEVLEAAGRPVTIVATKIDKLVKSKRKPALAALAKQTGFGALPFSALSGEGAPEVWHVIGSACGIV
jgi:GTP-binding protein